MIPQRYRKPLVITAAAIIVYALLGFFLAPWLVKNTATSAVRDNLGVELRLQKVAVNPFEGLGSVPQCAMGVEDDLQCYHSFKKNFALRL